jgi:hypothetical protein
MRQGLGGHGRSANRRGLRTRRLRVSSVALERATTFERNFSVLLIGFSGLKIFICELMVLLNCLGFPFIATPAARFRKISSNKIPIPFLRRD